MKFNPSISFKFEMKTILCKYPSMTINYLTSRNAIILAVFLVYFASANGQYCAATTSTSTTRYINNFTTGGAVFNINNASAFSAGGYGNFTAQSVSQIAGQAITFSAAYTGGTFGFRIWVDWNNDFDFADVGETLFTSEHIVPPIPEALLFRLARRWEITGCGSGPIIGPRVR